MPELTDPDAILARIDDVLQGDGAISSDMSVSSDAMRWSPEPPEPERPMACQPDVHYDGPAAPGLATSREMRWNGSDIFYERLFTVLAGPDGEPLAGTERMLYVEYTVLVPDDTGDVSPVVKGYAENLARQLGLTPVVSHAWGVGGRPFDPAPRGFGEWSPVWLRSLELSRTRFYQGCTLASWEPVAYPADGDWRPSWFAPAACHPGALADDVATMDAESRDYHGFGLLTDPLDDLAKWHGVVTERQYMERYPGDYMPTADPMLRQAVYDTLVHRRERQAGGKPLWTANLLPEPLRGPSWEMYVCRATDTHLIPGDNLNALRRQLAHR